MIKVIYGKKGVGKTKMIIDMANSHINTCHGDIVFIDDDKRYMYDLKHQIRFINIKEYVEGFDLSGFSGFLNGIMASNYDLECIYVDGFLRQVSTKLEDAGEFFRKLNKLSELHKVDFVLTVSGSMDAEPEFLKPYIVNMSFAK